MNFIIGDRVRIVTPNEPHHKREATVAEFRKDGNFIVGVRFADTGGASLWFSPDELRIIDYAPAADSVNAPAHYGGPDNPYEVIKVAEAWGLDKDAYLFNVLKYIARADKKGATLQDHKKARYYLDRKIGRLETTHTPATGVTAGAGAANEADVAQVPNGAKQGPENGV